VSKEKTMDGKELVYRRISQIQS